MANIKITELNEITEKTYNDVLPIVDLSADETKKVKVKDLVPLNVGSTNDNNYKVNFIKSKNLFDKDNTQWYRTNSTDFFTDVNTSTTAIRTNCFPIVGGKTYVVSGMPSGITLYRVRTYEGYNETYKATLTPTNNSFTLNSAVKYIHLYFSGTDLSDATNTLMANANIQLEEGSTATTYEAFKQNVINIDKVKYADTINVGFENNSFYKTNIIQSRNLFDKNNANILLGYVSVANQKIIIDNSSSKTLYISCKPNTTYTISKMASSTFVVCTATSVTNNTSVSNAINVGSSTTSYTITSGVNDKYLCVYYFSSSTTQTEQQILDSIQIELGSTATTYQPFVQKQMIVDNNKFTDSVNIGTEVDSSFRTNVLHSRNLFNKDGDTILLNTYILDSTQVIKSNNSTNSIYIPITGGKTYTISKKLSARFSVGTTKVLPTINVQTYDYIINNTATSITINTASDSKYLIVYLYNSGSDTLTFQQILDSVMINEGSTTLDYEPYITSSINVDGEEIYSKPVVLWRNSSPTSTFAPQTITLNDNLSNYEYYEILFYNGTTNTLSFSSGKVLSGTSPSYILYHSGIESGAVGNIRVRPITSVSDTQIVFDKAYQKVYNSNAITENNALDIPYRILGYKE